MGDVLRPAIDQLVEPDQAAFKLLETTLRWLDFSNRPYGNTFARPAAAELGYPHTAQTNIKPICCASGNTALA
jgi:hypothetical protein